MIYLQHSQASLSLECSTMDHRVQQNWLLPIDLLYITVPFLKTLVVVCPNLSKEFCRDFQCWNEPHQQWIRVLNSQQVVNVSMYTCFNVLFPIFIYTCNRALYIIQNLAQVSWYIIFLRHYSFACYFMCTQGVLLIMAISYSVACAIGLPHQSHTVCPGIN